MRRMLLSVVVLGCCLVARQSESALNTAVDWEDFNFSTVIYNYDDTTPLAGNLLFQLIADVGGDTVQSSLTGGAIGANDVLLDSGTWDGSFIQVSSAPIDPTYALTEMYIRFYNAPTAGAATHVGYIWDSSDINWVSPAAGDPAPVSPLYMDIDKNGAHSAFIDGTGTQALGWSTTVAIPEPGTMALFALGMLTMGARSLRRRK